MKYFDKVKLLVDKGNYLKDNVHKGEIGTIWLPEIRDNFFYIAFETDDSWNVYKYCLIKIEDLELVEDKKCPDEIILEELPKNDPRWWCKVEDGFIINLNGDKKNKIQYDYDS